ncbi:TetR/AcrR family transcriptional regulator [Spirosoma radiotolerans]|uniref:TetR family transcriptional regulator n=1 Tax=Spirosoma radiotolerans TaxID=1379870 RepID=A0A0E3V9S5_9BACT|nr:TetR/AcrR family transcriptional regulator [Spirosoma radiotolerans]AKD57421.1 TetR family transcriptional regulator [Spirosoma radiotolerans]
MARTKDFDQQDVLQKAVCLFWEKGYNGTSMQDLVDGLGISRSSLYDTFGDKYQLYLKALNLYKQQYESQVNKLTGQATSAKAAIQKLLEMVVDELLTDQQRKGCFTVNAGIELANQDSQVSQLVRETEQQLEQAFIGIIRQGQENGEIGKEKDAQALARFLNNTIKGIQVSVKSTSDRRFFDDIITTTLLVIV